MRFFSRRSFAGFTLVELMTVVTIVAVLSVVAVVSYKRYMRRARVMEGSAFLMDIKMKQETYFMTYSQYVDTGSGSNPDAWFPSIATPFPVGQGLPVPWGAWNCATATAAQGYYGFCALGMVPPNPDTYFQYVTIGWAPGDTYDPTGGGFIQDKTRRWWFARARTFMDDQGTLPLELRISSEFTDIREIQ